MTNMQQTQYKLEDFKVGQKVKVLVDLGGYISDLHYSRLGEVGEIIEIDTTGTPSVRVKFDRSIQGAYCRHKYQWYTSGEIQPVITTNTERQEEILKLEAEIQTLNSEVVKLKKEIKENPEKIKAEAGDTVKFTYSAIGECLMFIMQKEQANFFDPATEGYGNFVFVGPNGRNRVDVVNNGSHLKLELRKKNDYKWIDSSEVDWSEILKVAS